MIQIQVAFNFEQFKLYRLSSYSGYCTAFAFKSLASFLEN